MIEYFEIFAFLVAIILPFYFYCRWEYHQLLPSPSENDLTSKGIDVTPVSARLQQLRQDYTPELSHHSSNPKRQARLTTAREAIRNLSFFQQTPTPEVPEKDHEGRSFVF